MASSAYRIESLTKNNYDTWCLQAQAVLVKNELWDYVSGEKCLTTTSTAEETEKFKKNDLLARAELLLLISPSELKQIKGCTTSKELWDKLKNIYQSQGPARKATLLKQLVLKKHMISEDVRDHLNNFMDIVDKLADMDVKIHPDLLSIMMLYSLPASYENFRIAIESRDTLPLPEELKIKILEESEARINANNNDDNVGGAFYTKKKLNKYCQRCKKKGHSTRTCRSGTAVAKLIQNGCTVSSIKNKAYIKENNEITMMAKKENGLYYVHCDNPSVTNTVSDNNMMLWHQKLGHLNEKDLKLIDRNELIRGVNLGKSGKMPTCETCIKGKMTQLPYTSIEGPQSSEPLEIIYSDVCGPMRTETIAGSKYFLTFIDDFSKYCCVYFLRHKSEVFEKFKEYKNKVENCFNKKIRAFQSDNGREYCNKDFDSYLKENGIQRRLTAPYTPQQNGQSERKNRTLMDKARCLMIEANIPEHLWAEAIGTANYLINRCPTRALNGNTPYEKWTGRRPSGNHLKVFGSKAFVLNKQRRGKFTAKAKEGVFVGYAQNAKGFRVYFPERNSVVISRDVKIIDKMYYDNEDQSYDDIFNNREPLQPEKEKKVIKNTQKNKYNRLVDIEIKPSTSNKNKKVPPPTILTQPEGNPATSSQNNEDEVETGEDRDIDQDRRSSQGNTRPQRQRRVPNYLKDYDLDSQSDTSDDFQDPVNQLRNEEHTLLCKSENPRVTDEEWREAIKNEIKAHIKVTSRVQKRMNCCLRKIINQ